MQSSPEPERRGEGWGRSRRSSAVGERATAGFYLTAGLTFGAALLLCTGAGYWLDTRLQTLPLLTLVGALVGGVGAFLHLYRSLLGVRAREREREG